MRVMNSVPKRMNTAPATGSDINQIVNSALFLQQAENSSSINMQQQQLYMHFDANSTNGTTTTPPQSFASLPPQSAANTAMQQQHLNKTLHNSLLEKMASNNNNNNNIHNSNSNLSSLEASGNFFPRTSQLSTESNTSSLETSSNIQRQFEFIDGRRKVGSIDSAAFMMMGGGGADFDGNNNDKRNSASYIWTSQDAPAGATTNMTTTLRVNFYSEARNSTSPTRSSFSGPVSAFSTNNGGAISSSSKSPNSSSPSTGKKVYKYAPRTFGNKNNQTRSASNSNSNLSAILNDPNMDENERKRVVKNDLQNRFKQRLESKGGQPPEEQSKRRSFSNTYNHANITPYPSYNTNNPQLPPHHQQRQQNNWSLTAQQINNMLPPQFQHQSDYSDSSISTPPSYNFTPQSNDNNNSNDINPFVSITEEPGSNGLYQVQHLDGTQAQHFVELGVPFNFNGQQASLEQEEVMSPNGIMKKINMILLENAAASEMEGGGGVEDDIMGYSMSQSGFNTQYNNQQQPQNNSHQHNSHQLPKHQPPPPTLSLHFGGSNQQQLQHIGNDFPLMTPTTIIRHMLQEANNPNSFLQNPQQQMQSQSQAGGGLFESNINTSVPSPQQEFDAIMAFNSPTEEESPTRMFTNL